MSRNLWRDNGIGPHSHGTFKISKDPEFAEKVADIVGLYLDPSGGAVVLSVDEKTQIQALDRTQPVLPIDFDATEKRTHGYVRHGTTNLFAALNVGTGEVLGECTPARDSAHFLAFLKKAVKPHAGKDVHVVLLLIQPQDLRRCRLFEANPVEACAAGKSRPLEAAAAGDWAGELTDDPRRDVFLVIAGC